MNSPALLLRLLTCTALLAAAACASTPARRGAEAKIADLQVQVDVPPSWYPFLDDDIADALVRVLSERFRREGYSGVIDHVVPPRAPNPDLPLLSLRLVEWRINRTGDAVCTLSASIRAASSPGEIELGLIAHREITWIRERGRFGLARSHEVADAFEDSATGAMRELHRRIAETGAVRGLAAPAKR